MRDTSQLGGGHASCHSSDRRKPPSRRSETEHDVRLEPHKGDLCSQPSAIQHTNNTMHMHTAHSKAATINTDGGKDRVLSILMFVYVCVCLCMFGCLSLADAEQVLLHPQA